MTWPDTFRGLACLTLTSLCEVGDADYGKKILEIKTRIIISWDNKYIN
jgi:hypothetical protein